MTDRTAAEMKLMIPVSDGTRLAATLYLPSIDDPVPALLEALPYRKDDILGLESRPEYQRLLDEYGFAVCRIDVRGTGSSEGIADDEYPGRETDDLCEVISWLAAQPWCTGSVGMFGTSYSGFNSLHAAMRRPPELKAIVPIYASDDRFTDDVHYMGGVLRLLDLVDYPAYMPALNALPPVPSLAGPQWREQWKERLDNTRPWLLSWLENQRHGEFWQRGSVRPHYDRVQCPTMIVAGWADGYRNNTFRTVKELAAGGTPYRLVIGPWSHMATDHALPGPWIDLVPEMARWFDRWLRGTENGIDEEPPVLLFARRSTRPEPDLAQLNGSWRSEPGWPLERVQETTLRLTGDLREMRVRPCVGMAAWNDCAGSLPWGQPTDQRYDDADSFTWEWEVQESPLPEGPLELLGHPRALLTIGSDVPVAYVSVKLCDVFPDGTSVLITRGVLNMTHRTGHDSPVPLTPGLLETVSVELGATSWTLEPGHRLRLSVAGTDWPNTAAPPQPLTLTVDPPASALILPVVHGPSPCQAIGPVEARPATLADGKGVTWRVERDVLRRTVSCVIGHGSSWKTEDGTVCEDSYTGRVTVDELTFQQTVTARSCYTVGWPEATVTTTSDLDLTANEDCFDVTIRVTAVEGERTVFERLWEQSIPRDLA